MCDVRAYIIMQCWKPSTVLVWTQLWLCFIGKVPYIQANFAEEIYQSCQKHMALSLHLSVPIGHQWSIYYRCKVKFVHSWTRWNIRWWWWWSRLHFSPFGF